MQRSTKLVHNCALIDAATRSSSPAIHRGSTFDQNPRHGSSPYSYSRVSNPTRGLLEQTLCELEEGIQGFAFASGMAAIAAVFQLFEPGDHVLLPHDLYGGTFQLAESLAAQGKLAITYVDTSSLEDVRQHIRPQTRALYVETPSNPCLRIADIKALAALGRELNLITIADNTFMSPYLQRPLNLGFDIVIHSATKFLGGHSDVLAGAVIAKREPLAARLQEIQIMYGGILSPDDSWMVLRGLKTLGLRMDREQENARKLAEFLSRRPEVSTVYYPGLSSHPGHGLHLAQADGPGAVLSIELTPAIAVADFVAHLQLAIFAVSLGGVETIVSHPATMSHGRVPPDVRRRMGVTDQLLRISTGIEAIEDLLADFARALSAAGGRH